MTAIELPLPQFGIAWTVMVAVPESTLLADAVEQRNALIAGGLIVFVLGLVAFILLGRSIARPVSRIDRCHAQDRRGRFRRRSAVRRPSRRNRRHGQGGAKCSARTASASPK